MGRAELRLPARSLNLVLRPPRQVSYLGLEDSVDNDPCKFVLSCRGSSERFTLQAANVDIKQVWVRHIQVLLDDQSKFLYGEETCPELRSLSRRGGRGGDTRKEC